MATTVTPHPVSQIQVSNERGFVKPSIRSSENEIEVPISRHLVAAAATAQHLYKSSAGATATVPAAAAAAAAAAPTCASAAAAAETAAASCPLAHLPTCRGPIEFLLTSPPSFSLYLLYLAMNKAIHFP